MHLILTLDNADGMLFNKRRQSRDRVMNEHILTLVGGRTLWMNAYSAKLFDLAAHPNIRVSETYLDNAGEDDFCFDETIPPVGREAKTVYVFRWNRDYPADVRAGVDFSAYQKRIAEEFTGSSHEKITLEIYTK